MARALVFSAVAGICLCAAPFTRPIGPDLAAAPAAEFHSDAPLPTAAEFDRLAQSDPIAAVEAAIRRYQSEVKGFRASFHKRERIGGGLREQERIRVSFQSEPFSVLMKWEQGGGMADATLYVKGENAGQMQVKLARIGFVKSVDPRSATPRASARYTIEEFGLVESMKRTHRAWSEAKAAGQLQVDYLGRKAVPELGGRECHVIKRTCPTDEIDAYASGEPDEVTDKNRPDSFRTVTIYLDRENWYQVGSVLHRADGELVGSYFFRDLQLNPTFEKGSFSAATLKR
jgi:hypothetical protein